MEKSEEQITRRLKDIVKQLVYQGKIRNQREFGEKLGYKPAFTSQILSGHKLPSDLPNKVRRVFGEEWDIEAPQEKPTPPEAGETKTDLNEALSRALIRAQEEMIEANKAHRELTDALLDERDRWRETETKGPTVQAVQTSLDELRSMIARNFQHDEKVDLFLAEQIAKLAKIPTTKLLEMLHRAMIDEPTAQSMSKNIGSGSLSKA